MSFVLAERVKEISHTTGTGTMTLAGAYIGFQGFVQGIGVNNSTFYCISDTTTGEWEVGWGTVLTGPDRLQRDQVFKSSNANSLVNFSAGVHDVFCSPNAHKAILYPFDSFDLTLSGSLIVPLNVTVQGNLKTSFSGSFGSVTASTFKGDGTQLSNVTAATASLVPYSGIIGIPIGLVSSSIQVATGSFSGSFKGEFTGSGIQITGVISSSYANSASAATHAVQSDNAVTASFASVAPAAGITAGTMSGNFFINGNVSIPGTASVGQLLTIYTTSSIIYNSGSTKFGDTADDTHQFTGSVLILGQTNATGDITASNFKGNGNQITGVVSSSYAGTDWNAINNKPTVVSGSSQVSYPSLLNIPGGIVSSSLQINTGSFSGSFKGEFTGSGVQITGVVSSSFATSASYAGTDWNVINNKPAVVSASAQISYPSLSNIPGGIVSSSLQISTGSFSGSFKGEFTGSGVQITGVISSSYASTDWNAINNKPSIISSSIQINTGSFSGGFTGSLLGSSSYATTSSYASTAQNLIGSVNSASVATTASAANSLTFDPYRLKVADGVAKNYIISKPWTSNSTLPITKNWNGIIWAPEIGTLLAWAGNGATSGSIATSRDGVTWVTHSPPSLFIWNNAAWSPKLRMFVLVGTPSLGSSNFVFTSPDGMTWTSRTSLTENWASVVWSPEHSKFVALSDSGTIGSMTSVDGISWVGGSPLGTSHQYNDLLWAPEIGKYVATDQGNSCLTSTDGVLWSSASFGGGNATALVYSRELRTLAAIGTGYAKTSVDGTNWIARSLGSFQWKDVVWAPELGIFGAISFDGVTAARFAYSADGITWISSSNSSYVEQNGYLGITWAPELGSFFATAQSAGATSAVARSTYAWGSARISASLSTLFDSPLNNSGYPISASAFTGSFTGSISSSGIVGSVVSSSYAQTASAFIGTLIGTASFARNVGTGVFVPNSASVQWMTGSRWFSPSRTGATVVANTGAVLVTNRLYLVPFRVAKDANVSGITSLITAQATAASSGTVYLGIYNSSPSDNPTTALVTSTAISTDSGSIQAGFSASAHLTAGNVYWFAWLFGNSTATLQLRAINIADLNSHAWLLGHQDGNGSFGPQGGFIWVTGSYSSSLADLSTGSFTVDNTINPPEMFIKVQ